jgi:hypothetical protein
LEAPEEFGETDRKVLLDHGAIFGLERAGDTRLGGAPDELFLPFCHIIHDWRTSANGIGSTSVMAPADMILRLTG